MMSTPINKSKLSKADQRALKFFLLCDKQQVMAHHGRKTCKLEADEQTIEYAAKHFNCIRSYINPSCGIVRITKILDEIMRLEIEIPQAATLKPARFWSFVQQMEKDPKRKRRISDFLGKLAAATTVEQACVIMPNLPEIVVHTNDLLLGKKT